MRQPPAATVLNPYLNSDLRLDSGIKDGRIVTAFWT